MDGSNPIFQDDEGEHLEGETCVPDETEEPEEEEPSSGGKGGMSSPWYYYPAGSDAERDALKEAWAENPLVQGIPLRKVVIYLWCLKTFSEDACRLPYPVAVEALQEGLEAVLVRF